MVERTRAALDPGTDLATSLIPSGGVDMMQCLVRDASPSLNAMRRARECKPEESAFRQAAGVSSSVKSVGSKKRSSSRLHVIVIREVSGVMDVQIACMQTD